MTHGDRTGSHGRVGGRGGASRSRGALLLEVVVALTVLVTAMGFLGAELIGGLEMTRASEDQFRASLIADRVLAQVELEPNMQQRIAESPNELTGEVGKDYPGYFWRITTEPVDTEHLDINVVSIEILQQRDAKQEHNIDGAAVVRRLALLKADPPRIDLVKEAGLTEEQAEQLRQAIPIPGFDPTSLNLQQLLNLDPATLAQILPMLQPLLAQLGSGGLQGLMDQLGQSGLDANALGALANLPAQDLANTIRQAVGAAGQPGAANPSAPGATPLPNRPSPANKPPAPPPPPAPPQPNPNTPTPPPGPIQIGKGSGPNGEYTLEDLIRLRDAYEAQQAQQGGGP